MCAGYIDAEELHTAISSNRLLKKRLAEAAGVDAEEALETIEKAVITRMDQVTFCWHQMDHVHRASPLLAPDGPCASS